MITNRSNHMPMLTRMDMMNTTIRFWRTFLNQNNCGTITLQDIIMTQPHQYGPSARFMKVKRSVADCRCTTR